MKIFTDSLEAVKDVLQDPDSNLSFISKLDIFEALSSTINQCSNILNATVARSIFNEVVPFLLEYNPIEDFEKNDPKVVARFLRCVRFLPLDWVDFEKSLDVSDFENQNENQNQKENENESKIFGAHLIQQENAPKTFDATNLVAAIEAMRDEIMPLPVLVSTCYSLLILTKESSWPNHRNNNNNNNMTNSTTKFHSTLLGSTLSILCSRIHRSKNADELQQIDKSHLSFLHKFGELVKLPVWGNEKNKSNDGFENFDDDESNLMLFNKIANGAALYNEAFNILVAGGENGNGNGNENENKNKNNIKPEELQRGKIKEGPLLLPLAETAVPICYEALLPHDYQLEQLNRSRGAELALLRLAGWGVVEIPFARWRRMNLQERREMLFEGRGRELERLSAI